MKFVDPFYLLLVPVAAAAVFLFFARAAKRKKSMLRQILGERAGDPRAVHLAAAWRKWKHFLIGTALLLLLIAAARPYINMVSRDVETSGSDILILFDVSKSMRATDLPPSRMEQAKYLMREVIKAFPHDRFGVIPFAGSAFLSCPLTTDHTALAEAAEDLSTDSVPLGGTNIEAALQCADRAFAGADGDHRAVVLFTDGDELSGNTAAAAENFRKRGIPVVVAGFGDPAIAAPVPDGSGGVMRSADGKAAGSRLNESSLQKLAAETNGVYVRSSATDTGSKVIIGFLQQLADKGFAKHIHREVDDLFPWFIFAAVVLLTIAALLPERFRKRTAMILFAAVLSLPVQAAEEKLLALPEDPYELYAQGRKQQLAGDKNASQYYEKAVQQPDTADDLRAASLHNLGVLKHLDGREMLNSARTMLNRQQLAEAEKSVAAAEKNFNDTGELYAGSMRAAGVPEKDHDVSGGNFRQLLLDRKQAEELKKAIEEMKKQQQQQQNKQDQKQKQDQQQKNDKQQQKQDQQQKQSQGGEDDQQQKQDQQQQNKQDQKQEQDQQQKNDKQQNKEQQKQSTGEKDKQESKGSPPEQQSAESNQQEDSGKTEKERANERKLQLLDDESKALREAVRRRSIRRAPVEKDW